MMGTILQNGLLLLVMQMYTLISYPPCLFAFRYSLINQLLPDTMSNKFGVVTQNNLTAAKRQ